MSQAKPSVLLWEDVGVGDLAPLTLTRPAFELRTGLFNLRERFELRGATVHAHVRSGLQPLLALCFPDLVPPRPPHSGRLLVNARAHLSVDNVERMLRLAQGPSWCLGANGENDEWIAAWLDEDLAHRVWDVGVAETVRELSAPLGLSEITLFCYPWELVGENVRDLVDDVRAVADHALPTRRIFGVMFPAGSDRLSVLADDALGGRDRARIDEGAYLLREDNIWFGEGVRVKPGTVLDAEEGPIVLGAGCRIEANATVQGPAYIGPGSVVHPQTRIREGTTAGAFCKLGGEIEESVVLDLSNKQHDGFLGHAYVGSWVNLGAGTTVSDLKNNYGDVRVDLGDGPIDTGEPFVGPTIGDHAKTGIQTMLVTGAVVGVASNVFGAGFPPRFVPSFAWGGADGLTTYRLDDAIEVARRVLARRDVAWTDAHELLMNDVFDQTSARRDAALESSDAT